MLATKAPGSVQLDADEVRRIHRARLALRLNKLPHELDSAPLVDIMDVIEIMRADDELERQAASKMRARTAIQRRRR